MNILLILKGILIGIGKIIPGVSGSVIAISLGIYDKAINCVTSFFDNVKFNLKYLVSLGIGIILGVVFFSKIILYFLNTYYVYTMMLLIGLIGGGIFTVYKNCDKSKLGYIIIILGFLLMSVFTFFNGDSEYIIQGNFIDVIVFFISGILEGIGTIVPGISSTALLMIVGVYQIFISSISHLFDISYVIENICFFLSFGLGLFISIFGCIYFIHYLFSKYKVLTFSFILGIVLSNVLFLLLEVLFHIELKKLIIGILLLVIGIVISILFDT